MSFHDAISSTICQSTLYHVHDIYQDVIIPIQHYDQTPNQQQQQVVQYVPPSVVIFHESNAGSTVVSNLFNALTTFHINTMRMYIEPYPLMKAFMACDRRRRRHHVIGLLIIINYHILYGSIYYHNY
jgi:hypothetical protein